MNEEKGNLLEISNLHVSVDDTPIIQGLDLVVKFGEIHAIMGRNGSGKSTLANVLMGHPAYEITKGEIYFFGKNLSELSVDERAKAGMFLSFQYPMTIPGVQVGNFLRKSVSAVSGNKISAKEFRTDLKEKMTQLQIDRAFLSRYVNDGFSGGEKKRMEILQMLMLNPKLAILDETDSGLDIDALRLVSEGINLATKNAGCILITHYQRLLDLVKPDIVHIMIDGRIVKTGGADLAIDVENKGYDWLEV
ncbi:MAG: Fe-S cluster assembly ATPase SufC [Euryarchaeota archaeon]|nr:Fe-S cluster assembly ATPase SufC [Euryarchaeota archaeon]